MHWAVLPGGSSSKSVPGDPQGQVGWSDQSGQVVQVVKVIQVIQVVRMICLDPTKLRCSCQQLVTAVKVVTSLLQVSKLGRACKSCQSMRELSKL